MTFHEKMALSVAIENLVPDYLPRVFEIVQASMPLGSAAEEIKLNVENIDNFTLRELQANMIELDAVEISSGL